MRVALSSCKQATSASTKLPETLLLVFPTPVLSGCATVCCLAVVTKGPFSSTSICTSHRTLPPLLRAHVLGCARAPSVFCRPVTRRSWCAATRSLSSVCSSRVSFASSSCSAACAQQPGNKGNPTMCQTSAGIQEGWQGWLQTSSTAQPTQSHSMLLHHAGPSVHGCGMPHLLLLLHQPSVLNGCCLLLPPRLKLRLKQHKVCL